MSEVDFHKSPQKMSSLASLQYCVS